jgi:hypothetical protein
VFLCGRVRRLGGSGSSCDLRGGVLCGRVRRVWQSCDFREGILCGRVRRVGQRCDLTDGILRCVNSLNERVSLMRLGLS